MGNEIIIYFFILYKAMPEMSIPFNNVFFNEKNIYKTISTNIPLFVIKR